MYHNKKITNLKILTAALRFKLCHRHLHSINSKTGKISNKQASSLWTGRFKKMLKSNLDSVSENFKDKPHR